MKKRLLLSVCLCLAGCGRPPVENVIENALNIFVPEQHEKFSRAYSEHIVSGNFGSARSMVPTESFCATDMRGLEFDWADPPRRELTCSDDPSAIASALGTFRAGELVHSRTVNYHANRPARNSLSVAIEQEFVYEDIVLRVEMNYERDGNERRVARTTLTIDNKTLFGRMGEVMDAMPFNFFWWLVGVQLAAYLAVPLIVFWIVRRQRRQQENARDANLLA